MMLNILYERLSLYSDFVVVKHSLFAIPFAYLGAFLASGGVPSLRVLFWVGLAFIGARSAAMALNNLADRELDRLNPRTASRALPEGKISLKEVVFLILISYSILFYSAYRLNPLCLFLAPIVPATAFVYPYLKRFTSSSHLVLGLNLGYAPAGGWIAVTGSLNFPPGNQEYAIFILLAAVTLWVAGFDVIYSLQDIDFDRKMKLYSIPVIYGIEGALNISYIFHLIMLGLLTLLLFLLSLGKIYLTGLVLIALLIVYEHKIVSSSNFEKVPIAFFHVNAAVSITLLLFTILDVLLP
jgi:4-hydroxybenzoate polyprenyltransferase